MTRVTRFGVLVIGDEIVNGKRTDKHFPHVIESLEERGMQLAWSIHTGDERKHLVKALQWTQQDDIPVFCFGGIGATPDDRTRQAAAEAFGARLVRHPEALQLIERQFGTDAYPNRVLMAELPEDCLLIPNNVNRIAGFTLYDHHFFPGFPAMAWPMLEWVLDRYYPFSAPRMHERSLRLLQVPESDLIDLMDTMVRCHPDVKLFSLPRMGDAASIEIGFRGEEGAVEAAFTELLSVLGSPDCDFIIDESCADPGLTNRAVV
jgi:molybdopterin-biosynthesis enzyme MoeA-like protein